MDRFWSKVDKSGSCWEWVGARNNKGYGQIRINKRLLLAHRVGYELENSKIPDGMCVLHRCDNPSCVNPSHLFLGTVADNNRDMHDKGRAVDNRGERSGKAKLKEEDVKWIRQLGAPYRKIAKCFGISSAQVSQIKNRNQWRHVS